MAGTKRMTAEQVVSYLFRGEEGLDFLRESLWSGVRDWECAPSIATSGREELAVAPRWLITRRSSSLARRSGSTARRSARGSWLQPV